MVNFDAQTHTYTNENGEVLISVTQLLKQAGISPNYDRVDEKILKAAAEKGTLIHKEIEDYIKNGEFGFTRETNNFIHYLKDHNIKVLASEKLVHNDKVAGTIDLIVQYPDGHIAYVDLKTTSTIHTESVSWQLSIYKDLDLENDYENYADYLDADLEVWHFKKDGGLETKLLTEVSTPEIEKLYESIGGEKYEIQLEENALAELVKAEQIIAYYENEMKQAEDKRNKVREKILQAMKEKGITKFENDKIVINYIAPGTRETFDSSKFKKDNPDTYKKYVKTSDTKETVRIKLKEKNDE